MFAGERTGLEIFKGVFDGFGPYETSKRPTWAMNPVYVEGKLFSCLFKQGTGADDVVTCLKRGWVVSGMTARAEEEGGRLVLVLPDTRPVHHVLGSLTVVWQVVPRSVKAEGLR